MMPGGGRVVDKRMMRAVAPVISQDALLRNASPSVYNNGPGEVDRGGGLHAGFNRDNIQDHGVSRVGDADECGVFIEQLKFVIRDDAARLNHDKVQHIGSVQAKPDERKLLGVKEQFEALVFRKTYEPQRQAKILRTGIVVDRGWFWTDFHE